MNDLQLKAARDHLMKMAEEYNNKAKLRPKDSPLWAIDIASAQIFLELSVAIHAAITVPHE